MKPPRLLDQRPGWLTGLTPPTRLEVSAWSDAHRLLNQRSAAEPGKWRTSRTPYLRELMDDLSSHSPIQRVTFMKGAQIGGTEAGNNWIAYQIDHVPGPSMVVQPTVDMGKRWSKQRLTPMIEEMECLNSKILDNRSRDSGNTTLSKEYSGGILIISGANSASGLRSMPVKNLMLDEVDAYPYDVDGEGDPVELAINRTKTFSRKKIFMISTPTSAGMSRIEKAFNDGDQRRYYVPCPHCEEKQTLEMPHLHWEKDEHGQHLPETAQYTCIHCGALIAEHNKPWMLEHGEWRAEGAANDNHHSYHINSLYSPLGWESWADIADKFLKAKGDSTLLKTFTNTIEGLPFEETEDKFAKDEIFDRAENYPLGECQHGDLVLTAGVDTQPDRFEVVVYAHNMTSARAIDYHVIHGNPDSKETLQALDDYLASPFAHASGTELMIQAAGIDSGGHNTQAVYDFCRRRKRRHIFALKGYSQKGKPIIGKPSKVDVSIRGKTIQNGAELWMIGTDTAKSQIYNRLKITDPQNDGYIHYSTELPPDFFKQLTAEKIATRRVKGFLMREWVKPAGARNEVLDCTVYAIAAYYHLGLNRWRPAQWRQLEERVQPPTADLFASQAATEQDQDAQKIIKTVKPRRTRQRRKRPNRGGFLQQGGIYGA